MSAVQPSDALEPVLPTGAPYTPAEIEVPGDPVPHARVNNPKTGGKFIPSRQANHAGLIMQAWQNLGREPFPRGTGLVLIASFFVKRPGYHYGTGRNAGKLKDRYRSAVPTGRPDLSNLVKLAEDSLTTVAFHDDDQVVQIVATKQYADMPLSRIGLHVLDATATVRAVLPAPCEPT